MQADTVARAFYEHWICLYGAPLTISSDQDTQFESALFTALTKLVGAKRTRTTSYHPQANGMVKRFHRTLKAALMCSPHTPWPDLLPSVLLGLRTAFKEDLQASPAEMLYGMSLQIPGEFFVTDSIPASSHDFVGKLRLLFRDVKAVPASRHTQQHPFVFKDLQNCTHVFKRVDSIRKQLRPPYTGPYEVVKRLDDRTYIIRINGLEKTISTDALKPAYLESADPAPEVRHLQTSNHPPPASTDAVTKGFVPLVLPRRGHWGESGCGGRATAHISRAPVSWKKAEAGADTARSVLEFRFAPKPGYSARFPAISSRRRRARAAILISSI